MCELVAAEVAAGNAITEADVRRIVGPEATI